MTQIRKEVLFSLLDDHAKREPSDWLKPSPHPVNPKEGTVAIVGKGLDHCLVPWGYDGYEYWGLNDQPSHPEYAPLRCYTRWFQLHPPSYLAVHYPRGIADLEAVWGVKHGIPLYMDKHYDWLPDSVPYPKDEIEQMVPFGEYHCSSFDWMIALAIYEGWSRIELYGVDFYTFPTILNGEPLAARPCLEFWLGVAAGRGSDIAISQRGDLFCNIHVGRYKSDLQYGFEREPALDLSLTDNKWSDVR